MPRKKKADIVHAKSGYNPICRIDFYRWDYLESDDLNEVDCEECLQEVLKSVLGKLNRSTVLKLVAPKIS